MDTRIAVITGAGSGIGRAVARTLIARGWHAAALGRRRDRLEETLDGAPGCLAIEADIAAPEAVRAAFAQVAETYGRLDVLFNNAGMFGPADDVGAADWNEVAQTIDVNATGAFYCASAAFDLMRERGGRIINNGSISAQVPRPHSVAYAMSKHAVAGLTKAIIIDGRPHRITATQVDIGNAATEILSAIGTGDGALQPDGSWRAEPSFDPEIAGRMIADIAGLPLEATVDQLTLTASGMPFPGRG